MSRRRASGQKAVAPVRERGLKLLLGQRVALPARRSCEGAGIEILYMEGGDTRWLVAPARERGLK